MLKTAVKEYRAPEEQAPIHIPSSPPRTQQRFLSQTSRSHGLRQAPLSSANARQAFKPPAVIGVKRTPDGLAKATDGAWEEEEWTAYKTTQTTAVKYSTGKTEVFELDENDFSDIELEVEVAKAIPPPRAAKSQAVSYPALPSPTRAQAVGNLISPTQPRQQQVQSRSFEIVENCPPPSTGALPWSSSPPAHLEPKNIKAFEAPALPTSRRTLPWVKEEASKSATSIIDRSIRATPIAKPSKQDAYFNMTASGLKDNKKRHRDQDRKIKTNAATEEALSAIKVKKKQRVPQLFLSEEQKHVLKIATEAKQSVFFTGSAGTGKSVLLREIIAALRRQYSKEQDRIAVTASTGLAACNIGGVTLHSFAGIGLGKEDPTELVRKIKRNQKAKHRWLRTKVLIIDEVSMVDGELFDKLESVARQMRNNGRPFGGIQLIITGDFFQLPPVPDRGGPPARFAFDAATWPNVIEHTIGLHQVFRQKDPVFAGMLNEMREGRLSEGSIKAFQSLSGDPSFEDSIGATELFPLRHEVDRANKSRLDQLQGDPFVYEARDGGSITDKVHRDKILSNCMAPEQITLKKGAQVMLIKNVDETLANGSIGNVVAFMDEQQFEKHSSDDELHLQEEEIMATAPSLELSKEELARKRLTENTSSARRWPYVRFNLADGTTRDMLCQPEVWKTELPNGEVQASRSQIPLILSWALSIHKAQGQTLERVKVDLGRVFEKGQAYVALSRATSMQGLQVLNFDARKVRAHEKVVDFYSKLARVELQETIVKAEVKPMKIASEYERRYMKDTNNV